MLVAPKPWVVWAPVPENSAKRVRVPKAWRMAVGVFLSRRRVAVPVKPVWGWPWPASRDWVWRLKAERRRAWWRSRHWSSSIVRGSWPGRVLTRWSGLAGRAFRAACAGRPVESTAACSSVGRWSPSPKVQADCPCQHPPPGTSSFASVGSLVGTPACAPGPGGGLGGELVLRWREYPPEGRRVMLWGLRQECETLGGLLADVRAGRSRALVLRGEPGIGKTALLGYAAETAPDFRVARAEGVES